jgi:hypothetical protein
MPFSRSCGRQGDRVGVAPRRALRRGTGLPDGTGTDPPLTGLARALASAPCRPGPVLAMAVAEPNEQARWYGAGSARTMYPESPPGRCRLAVPGPSRLQITSGRGGHGQLRSMIWRCHGQTADRRGRTARIPPVELSSGLPPWASGVL